MDALITYQSFFSEFIHPFAGNVGLFEKTHPKEAEALIAICKTFEEPSFGGMLNAFSQVLDRFACLSDDACEPLFALKEVLFPEEVMPQKFNSPLLEALNRLCRIKSHVEEYYIADQLFWFLTIKFHEEFVSSNYMDLEYLFMQRVATTIATEDAFMLLRRGCMMCAAGTRCAWCKITGYSINAHLCITAFLNAVSCQSEALDDICTWFLELFMERKNMPRHFVETINALNEDEAKMVVLLNMDDVDPRAKRIVQVPCCTSESGLLHFAFVYGRERFVRDMCSYWNVTNLREIHRCCDYHEKLIDELQAINPAPDVYISENIYRHSWIFREFLQHHGGSLEKLQSMEDGDVVLDMESINRALDETNFDMFVAKFQNAVPMDADFGCATVDQLYNAVGDVDTNRIFASKLLVVLYELCKSDSYSSITEMVFDHLAIRYVDELKTASMVDLIYLFQTRLTRSTSVWAFMSDAIWKVAPAGLCNRHLYVSVIINALSRQDDASDELAVRMIDRFLGCHQPMLVAVAIDDVGSKIMVPSQCVASLSHLYQLAMLRNRVRVVHRVIHIATARGVQIISNAILPVCCAYHGNMMA